MQRVGDVYEVGERVDLVHHFTVFVPLPAALLSAANMCDGIYEAAVQQAYQCWIKVGQCGATVGAVAIDQPGRRAIEGGVAVIREGNGHQRAVAGGHVDSLCRILSGVKGARYLCLFQQLSCASV